MSFLDRLRQKKAESQPDPRSEDDPRNDLTAAERMDICRACPHLGMFNRCDKCGCLMVLKTRMPHARCPIDKW